MALSNAERQRRFRARRDADTGRRDAYIQKGKERYRNDRNSGKIKPVEQMTDREKRSARKRWRIQKKRERLRQKELKNACSHNLTPPASPAENIPLSRQKQQQQKIDKSSKAKHFRERKKMKIEIDKLRKKVNMYKQRLSRCNSGKTGPNTPRRRVRNLLKHLTPKEAKRSLFKYEVLQEALRKKYQEKKKNEKKDLLKVMCDKTLKKYKLKTEMFMKIGCCTSRRNSQDRFSRSSRRVIEKVHTFYLRNDNSRLITGKRQTKTFQKQRKQRRLLLHNLKTLHQKFISEGPTKISYSGFCRLRPFYVVFPRPSDRDTCLCKICNNTELMAEALKRESVITSNDLHICIKATVCDTSKQDCMYGECALCKERKVQKNRNIDNHEINWQEWKTKKDIRHVKQGNKVVQKQINITVKENINGNIEELFDKFDEHLKRYRKHAFRTNNQYSYYRKTKENLSENEAVIHIDFSENYVCGYSKAVQGTHFGASKKQLTLHTGVVHLKDQKPSTFCTVSESLNHGPEGVWAHLKPILSEIKERKPSVTKIEIFSDGPVTQYRQKGNFFLSATKAKEYGFEMKWSFFEAGHGKGVPDAVGGSIKRKADNVLKYGGDITSAATFCAAVSQDSNIKIYIVPEEDIQMEKAVLDRTDLNPIKGTLNLHQVVFNIEDGQIGHRQLSCSCKIGNEHEHHKFQRATLISKIHENSNVKNLVDENNNEQNKADENDNEQNKVDENNNKQNKLDENNNKQNKLDENNNEQNKVDENNNEQNKLDENNNDQNKLDENNNEQNKLDENNNEQNKVDESNNEVDGHNNTQHTKSKESQRESRTRKNPTTSRKRKQYPCEQEPVYKKQKPGKEKSINYKQLLKKLSTCQSKDDLQQHLGSFPDISMFQSADEVCLQRNKLKVDYDAVDDMPSDITLPAGTDILLPVRAKANGNCLPCCGSVYAFNTTNKCDEMRARIVQELCDHESIYLDDDYLKRGLADGCTQSIKSQYAQYSEVYIPGMCLSDEVIQDIYRKELLSITHDGSFMGIWQLFALSSILKCPIFSVYPNKGNESVRKDLNRLILPRAKPESQPVHILWTNTRNDIPLEHWVPNHFVPLISYEKRQHVENIELNPSAILDTSKGNTEARNDIEDEAELEKEIHGLLYMLEETDIVNEIPSETSEQRKESEYFVPEINECLNKHVLIRFNNQPYPGYVQDIDTNEVEVLCMNKVGRKEANRFFWPQKMKDLAWYTYDEIMTVIPEPTQLENTRHYMVDENLLSTALNMCK